MRCGVKRGPAEAPSGRARAVPARTQSGQMICDTRPGCAILPARADWRRCRFQRSATGMTSLTLRLWRRCRTARRTGARRCVLGAAALAAWAALAGAQAAESRSSVTVDLGVLDALAPPAQPY